MMFEHFFYCVVLSSARILLTDCSSFIVVDSSLIEKHCSISLEKKIKNAVMPLDVLGRTRATLMKAASIYLLTLTGRSG
jgi:hypothetical protein